MTRTPHPILTSNLSWKCIVQCRKRFSCRQWQWIFQLKHELFVNLLSPPHEILLQISLSWRSIYKIFFSVKQECWIFVGLNLFLLKISRIDLLDIATWCAISLNDISLFKIFRYSTNSESNKYYLLLKMFSELTQNANFSVTSSFSYCATLTRGLFKWTMMP